MRKHGYLLALFCVSASAYGEAAIDLVDHNVRTGSLNVHFNCDLRLLSHTSSPQDKTLTIRLLQSSECARTPTAASPPSLASAGDSLMGVAYNADGREFLLTLTFIESGSFLVSQGSTLDEIQISRSSGQVELEIAPSARQSDAVTEEQLQAAKSHLVDGEYDRATSLFQGVLSAGPEEHHPQALEYLALTYQLSGRTELARERYQTWLDRYGQTETPDSLRIQQRLGALSVSESEVATAGPRPPAQDRNRWHLDGGIGQDIWSIAETGDFAGTELEDAQATVAMTYVDGVAEYRGRDVAARAQASIGYRNTFGDLEADDEVFARLLFAEAHAGRYKARAGRQRLYGDGILGLFDGLRLSRTVGDTMTANVTVGLPVDNPRYASDQDRQFVAASLDVADFFGTDVTVYGHTQKVAGIWDRQAIGANWRRGGSRWHTQGRLDFDVSYEVLNTALFEVGFKPTPGLSTYARVNFYAYPYIGTHNALWGQPTSSLDELLDLYTDGQLRTIARNRTTDVTEFSTGMHLNLGQRWRALLDSSHTQLDETVESVGVAGRPETTQITTSVSLLGGSVFRSADSLQLRYALFSDEQEDAHRVSVDWRFGIGDKLRLRPRLSVTQRLSDVHGDQQAASAALKLSYLFRRHYELSAEIVARHADRELALSDPFQNPAQDATDLQEDLVFVLQWRADL